MAAKNKNSKKQTNEEEKVNGSQKKNTKVKNSKKKKKSNRGRKSVYDWKVKPKLHLIADWMRNGATEEEVYKKLGISHQTFYRYKRLHSELNEALKTREEADAEVVAALFKRAKGYIFEEQHNYETISEKDGYKKTTKTIIKHIEPDTTAIAIWLNNRRPEDWRQKQREITVKHEREDDPITAAIKEEIASEEKEEE